MIRRNHMYGNENGLPGLPKTTYVAVGGRRSQPPPRTQMRPGPILPMQAPMQAPMPAPMPMRTSRPMIAPQPIYMPSGPDPTLARRIDSIDLRLNSAEQSNRTLLDELMRLQQDIKANVRKNEVGIQEERDNRTRLESTFRQAQGKTYETDERIRRCEDGIKDNANAVQQLSTLVKNIERMVTSLQQEQIDKKSESSKKLQEYRAEVLRLTHDNEQLEKIVNNNREEGRTHFGRIDNIQADIVTLQNNIRLHSTLMEEYSNKPAVIIPKSTGIDQTHIDNERANTDRKIMQLNSTIQDLSERHSTEALKRQKAEEGLHNRLNQITGEVSSTKSKGDQAQKDYDDRMKGLHLGIAETDKQNIRMELARIATDLNTKIDANDATIKNETVNKLTVIERTLKEENKRRAEKEKELEGKLEKGMQEMRENGEKDNLAQQSTLDSHVSKQNDKLSTLNKRMNDVEEVVRNHKLENEKLLAAEITERLNSDKVLDAKIEGLDDDVDLGFKTLYDYVGQNNNNAKTKTKPSKEPKTPLIMPPSLNMDEITKMHEKTTSGLRTQVTEELGNLEKRVSELENEMKQKDDSIDNKIMTGHANNQEKVDAMSDELQKQVDSLYVKHNKLRKKVNELHTTVSDTPKNLKTHKEETAATLTQLSEDLEKEKEERKEDVQNLQNKLTKIVGSENPEDISTLIQMHQDIDHTHTGLKKCAEAIHVVKTMLGDKFKDEKRIRDKETKILNTDIERLDTKIKDLKDRIKNISAGQDTGPSARSSGPSLDDTIL